MARRILMLLTLVVVGLLVAGGVALAADYQCSWSISPLSYNCTGTDVRDVYVENDPLVVPGGSEPPPVVCPREMVHGGDGKDSIYLDTSNETTCPGGDEDVGHGQFGNGDLVDASDPDTLDEIAGGPGRRDTCIRTVDQHGTADVADDTRDAIGGNTGPLPIEDGGCEIIKEVIYNPPQP